MSLRKAICHSVVLSTFCVQLLHAQSMSTDVQREGAAQSDVRRHGDIIIIRGDLVDSTAKQFSRLLAPDVRAVVITSAGGDAVAAMTIGREIRVRNLKLVVSKACASACASFIFMTAKDRTVLPNSLVVLHNTNSSMLRMLGNRAPKDAQELFAPKAAAEKQYYSAAGIPSEVLFRPLAEVRARCYKFGYNAAGTLEDVPWSADYKGWVPPLGYIEGVSGPVKGFWPTTAQEFGLAYLAVFKPNTPIAAMGSNSTFSEAALDQFYSLLKPCP